MITKAGQICTIDGSVYRAKKSTLDCTGCDMNSFLLCPRIPLNGRKDILCRENGLIFKRM